MPTNDFKPFAVGGGASVISQATYAAATALLADGFQVGVADETYLNKVWRQSSLMAATIGKLINDETGLDAIDDGTTATLLANLKTAVQVLAAAIANSNVTITTTGGSTTLSGAQYGAGFIFVTGVLASDATFNFPAQTGRWVVINNTTGAHTLTCKTAAGTGVTVKQGGADTIIGDATNIRYALLDVVTQTAGDASSAAASTLYVDKAVSTVGGFYQDTGAANAYVITTIPPTTAYVDGASYRFRVAHSNTGASTLDTGAGPITMTREGGATPEANDLANTQVVTVTYVAAAGPSFVINGTVASDFLDSPALRGTPTAPTPTAGDNSTLVPTTAFVQGAVASSSVQLGLYALGVIC